MSDLKEAQSLVDFVNLSPSPFHAVAELSRGFEAAGFKRIYEDDSWNLEKAGNYFFTRNQSSLIAFSVGKQYQPGNGFSIVAAHTDSPCLKLKPRTKKESQKFEQLAVQTYGGGLWHTWFDRDLGLAGRVIVREEGKYISKLINITRPILRIPSLCIHLGREVSEAFKFNFETHLIPVIGGVAPKTGDSSSSASSSSSEEKVGEEHYSLARDASGTNSETLLDLICAELSVKRDQIAEIELCLADTQPGTLAGAHNEFIFSARLDNLFNCYTGMKSLINSSGDLESEKNIRVAAFFDNEEVGSVSNAGADSILMEQTIHRCIHGVNGSSPLPADIYERSLRRSFLISADMAHACHPNYSEKHESAHQPRFDQGLVIKTNANMRYATNSATALIIHHLSKQYNVPTQEFVVKNDSACGSTIGPSLSARGLRTVDVGCAQLSMHSIREMCGSADAALAVRLFEGFFKSFAEVDETILIDRAI